MLSEILEEKEYQTVLILIYEGNEVDEWQFRGVFNVDEVMYDGDTIECYTGGKYSSATIRMPVVPDSEVKWFEESESFEYRAKGKRYEFYFD